MFVFIRTKQGVNHMAATWRLLFVGDNEGFLWPRVVLFEFIVFEVKLYKKPQKSFIHLNARSDKWKAIDTCR